MLRPKAKEVTPLNDFKLKILFDTGEIKIYDLKPQLGHLFFAPLNDINLFNTAHSNGITVEWDNEIDICPDDLYYNSKPF